MESLEVVTRAWYQERFDFEGKFYSYKDISLRPHPVQNRVPTYVASISPETFDLARQWGHGIMASLLTNSANQIIKGLSAFRAGLAPETRWSQPIPIMTPVYVGQSMDSAYDEIRPSCQWYWDTVGKILPQKGEKIDASYHYFQKLGEKTGGGAEDLARTMARWPIGDADHVTEFIFDLCQKSTADEIICFASIGAIPLKQAINNIERIARDVMPRVRAAMSGQQQAQLAAG
jgi:alkanesulfonate monooxygenase SsuD/methylene tetrahydromethanopterin reductase-like flavin-dependent oxidoreductase (luciferase family)